LGEDHFGQFCRLQKRLLGPHTFHQFVRKLTHAQPTLLQSPLQHEHGQVIRLQNCPALLDEVATVVQHEATRPSRHLLVGLRTNEVLQSLSDLAELRILLLLLAEGVPQSAVHRLASGAAAATGVMSLLEQHRRDRGHTALELRVLL
jgi:hypothetical protein